MFRARMSRAECVQLFRTRDTSESSLLESNKLDVKDQHPVRCALAQVG